VDDIASNEPGSLIRTGIIIHYVDFTYVNSISTRTILPQMLPALDDIHNSWANEVCRDWLAGAKLDEYRC
jgi:hypothetical protein